MHIIYIYIYVCKIYWHTCIFNETINKLFTSIMWFIGKTAANPILLIITNQVNASSIAEYPILASGYVLFKLTVSYSSILKCKTKLLQYITIKMFLRTIEH